MKTFDCSKIIELCDTRRKVLNHLYGCAEAIQRNCEYYDEKISEEILRLTQASEEKKPTLTLKFDCSNMPHGQCYVFFAMARDFLDACTKFPVKITVDGDRNFENNRTER